MVEQRPGGEANDREQLGEKDLLFDHATWDEYLTPDAGVGQWGRCQCGCDPTEQCDSQVAAQRFVMCHVLCHGMRRALCRE